ncbi:unnamed protein product [Allacma fusca]|uniref:CHHC U11-48K-type domain-containing protein n=1 Tax=Allacma fusca TaxID=39272 RepID=A0A8J2PZJ7_9HEXA|nr:unnamed protein product [Allacma fusca]
MDMVPEESPKPFNLAPGEIFIQCPYNQSHHITDARLMVHLQRCRRNYIMAQEAKGHEVEFSFCRFNYVHQVPRVEIAFHEKHCDDQFSVLKHMSFHSSNEFTKFKQSKRAQMADQAKTLEENVEEQEVWDMSGPGFKYDPSLKLQNQPILHLPNNVTWSERQAYRKEHHLRFIAQVTKKTNPEKGDEVDTCKDETTFVTKNVTERDADKKTEDYPSNRVNDGDSRVVTQSGQGGTDTGSVTKVDTRETTTKTGSCDNTLILNDSCFF